MIVNAIQAHRLTAWNYSINNQVVNLIFKDYSNIYTQLGSFYVVFATS